MKRRSKAGGAAIKGRRRKTPEPKRSNAPRPVPRSKSSKSWPSGEETEVARLTRERDEALEQQTATGDVLKIISRPSFDLQAVLDTLIKLAARLCEADLVAIHRPRDGAMQFAANFGLPQEWVEIIKRTPIVPGRGTATGRVLLTGKAVQIADVEADPEYTFSEGQRAGGFRTVLAVPLEREGETIGVIVLCRTKVHPFTDKQIDLVQNFAAQAVIAIENARLLNELRQRTTDLTERTADLTEALDQQTATTDVLQVISRSTGDLQPVFEAMLANAVRICDGKFGSAYRWDGIAFSLVATHNMPPALVEARRRSPMRPDPRSPSGRVVATKAVVHVADLAADQSYIGHRVPAVVAAVELGGIRTSVSVPMMKKNELVGALTVYRQEVRPFTEKQIELVINFAAQAVIAIENARLLNELRQRTDDLTERTVDLTEALEQQTATSEVLQAISGSPGDLQPVFATMLENMVRVCHASFGAIHRCHGDVFQFVAEHNSPPAYANLIRHSPFHPGPHHYFGPMMASKSVEQFPDLAASQGYLDRRPEFVSAVELGGVRTGLNVPMLKKKELIGVFALARKEIHPFTNKQIKLVENFAAQAVIAIENARLLNELRQALEQQTATRRPHTRRRVPKLFIQVLALPSGRRQIANDQSQIADVTLEQGYSDGDPFVLSAVKLGGYRSVLSVPLLHEDEVVGVISIFRQEANSFSDEHVSLLQNFAAQAVIAIENARLLSDLRERTQELSALNEHLEHRVADQVGEIERMGRLRRFLPPQVADLIVASGAEKQLESHRREITALFCDLRGFTGFTESADAEDVMALLRDYHAAIGELVIRYSGTLERYAGDGVMVVFNDPVPVENPALQAVLMALELRAALGALTQTWSRLGHEIGYGICIAHGFATLGTIGYEGRFDYAAIGTVSNVASRLCDEAKPGQILISPRVLTKVENAVKVEPVGEFALKGIRRPLAAYNVVAATSVET